MPPWATAGVAMRRKAKSEGRIQGYNDILKYYKAEVRRIFPNNTEENNLYNFLQEKYTVLYFWPDRADWDEHWEEWFDDERSQPYHTITLSDKKRTKTGPKLTCSSADWDVYQARKAGVTPAGYTTKTDTKTKADTKTPLWSVQGNSLRNKAKREMREQEYDEVLRVYKDEARRVFTNFAQHMNVNRFLQEKYTVLRFWPDRADWAQHWFEWYEDERSQPKHTTIEKGRKMGPKLTISLSDWEVYVSKAFDTYSNKAKATHRRYLDEVAAASTSTDGYGAATNAQSSYASAQGGRVPWSVNHSMQSSQASKSKKGPRSTFNYLPESHRSSFKTEEYTEQPFTAPESTYSDFRPDSYTPYAKTESNVEIPWNAPKSRTSNFSPDVHTPYVKTEDSSDFFRGNDAPVKPDLSSTVHLSGMQPNPPAYSGVKREVDRFLDNMDYEFDRQHTKKRRTDNGSSEGHYYSRGSEWN